MWEKNVTTPKLGFFRHWAIANERERGAVERERKTDEKDTERYAEGVWIVIVLLQSVTNLDEWNVFELILTTFKSSVIFRGSWGSSLAQA